MGTQYEHNGHKYWVYIENAVDEKTGENGFIAYVNDNEPTWFNYGISVKDQQSRTIMFADKLSASTYANDYKHAEINAKPNS